MPGLHNECICAKTAYANTQCLETVPDELCTKTQISTESNTIKAKLFWMFFHNIGKLILKTSKIDEVFSHEILAAKTVISKIKFTWIQVSENYL